MTPSLQTSKSMPTELIRTNNEGGSPFPPLDLNLPDSVLKETAYEILLLASGSLTIRALTYTGIKKSAPIVQPVEKSVASAAASRMKKVLGLKSRWTSDKQKKPTSAIEIVRMQMGLTELLDARVRRALSRATAGQAGKRLELVLIPIELLQNISAVDFSETKELRQWQHSQLDILEAGLLLHSRVPLDTRELLAQRLKQVLYEIRKKSLDTGRNSESMQALRSACTALSSRSLDGADEQVCHWADGFPLNIHLYQMLLQCCFDSQEPAAVIDEMDEVLDLMKKTWGILGVNQVMHNVCFLWILFRQFLTTGETELELLGAAQTQMREVSKDAKTEHDPIYVQLLSSILSTIQASVEQKLFSYHDTFPEGAAGLMDKLIPSALAAAQILQDDIAQEYRRRRKEHVNITSTRVDAYIRSSLRSAFAQMMEQVVSKRKVANDPPLAILAQDTMTLMAEEKNKYTPILKQWHSNAAGVAAATLHSCYARELKQYLAGVKLLTAETVQIFQSADELEKQLVQTLVEDAVDSEDGGKGLIREMPPFEADSTLAALSKQWVQDSLQKIGEWADRSMKQEEWSPHFMREHYAPSVVELLRIVEETIDAFFAFPVLPPVEVLQDLVNGIDRILYRYASYAVSNCDSKKIPNLPPLTRWNKDLHGKSSSSSSSSLGWFKKEKRKGQVEPRNVIQVDTSNLQRQCVRINTLHHLETELVTIEKKIRYGWQESSNDVKKCVIPEDMKFDRAHLSCRENIQKLIECGAHRAVFEDMRKVFYDGLYCGGVKKKRIDEVIQQLDSQLEVIASTVCGKMRNKFVSALMKSCFEAFTMVVLAGGPLRAFDISDGDLVKEDFVALKELFKADGEGLGEESVEKHAAYVMEILVLFSMESEELIEKLKLSEGGGGVASAAASATLKIWNSRDANTILRVLCHRADPSVSHFLKKSYNLPKRI